MMILFAHLICLRLTALSITDTPARSAAMHLSKPIESAPISRQEPSAAEIVMTLHFPPFCRLRSSTKIVAHTGAQRQISLDNLKVRFDTKVASACRRHGPRQSSTSAPEGRKRRVASRRTSPLRPPRCRPGRPRPPVRLVQCIWLRGSVPYAPALPTFLMSRSARLASVNAFHHQCPS